MLNCYCQLSSSVIFRQYGVSQSECKIDQPRPGLSRLSPRPHTKALGTRLRNIQILDVEHEKIRDSCQALFQPMPKLEEGLILRLVKHGTGNPGMECGMEWNDPEL